MMGGAPARCQLGGAGGSVASAGDGARAADCRSVAGRWAGADSVLQPLAAEARAGL